MAAATVPALWSCSSSCSERGKQLFPPPSLISLASSKLQVKNADRLVAVNTSTLSGNAPSASRQWLLNGFKVNCALAESRAEHEPLRVMISGAPASGKETQCEYITEKYGLLHISTEDLLRAEVAAGTENGLRAKDFMNKGQLVPDDIMIQMVKVKLEEASAQEKGWLLDGFPHSLSQGVALKALGIMPDVFVLLDVPEETLLERVVGRRIDPVTGRIYHLEYTPPENEEIAARLTQRFDDTEAKAKVRLQSYALNVEALASMYSDVMRKVDGNQAKTKVFEEIEKILTEVEKKKKQTSSSGGTKVALLLSAKLESCEM